MFDLPMETAANRKDYMHFRKYLLKTGFFMLQQSVYCKLTQNQKDLERVLFNVKQHKPSTGSVMALSVTEKQFSRIEYLVGTDQSDMINDTSRLVIL